MKQIKILLWAFSVLPFFLNAQDTIKLHRQPPDGFTKEYTSATGFATRTVLFQIKANCEPAGQTLDTTGSLTQLLVNTGNAGSSIRFTYDLTSNKWKFTRTYVSASNVSGGGATSADTSVTNEIQALSFTTPNLTLSNGGGTVDLSPLATTWVDAGSTSSATDGIAIGTVVPDATSILDLTSATRGFLPPRMTTSQRTAIASPAIGLQVFDTDLLKGQVYDGTRWTNLDGSFSLILAADFSNNTVTATNVTGMSFTAAANAVYDINVLATLQTVVSTTGANMFLDIPSGDVIGQNLFQSTAAGGNMTQQISDNSGNATTAVPLANTDTPLFGRYMVRTGATGGAVQLRFNSEVAASNATLKAGTATIAGTVMTVKRLN